MRHDQPLHPRARRGDESRDPGREVHDGLVAVQLVLAARDAHIAKHAREARDGAVDGAVAAHDLGGGAHLDIAIGLDTLDAAGLRLAGRAGGRRWRGGARGCAGRGFLEKEGDQRIATDTAIFRCIHDGAAARDGHAPLRPVFEAVARRDAIIRRRHPQVAPGQHHHGLVDVIDGAVAIGAVGRGEDADIALCLEPPDFRSARGRVTPRAGAGDRGGLRTAGGRARAVAGNQPVRLDGDTVAHRARTAARDDQLFLLAPFDAVLGGDIHRSAARHVEGLRHREVGQQQRQDGQMPHGALSSTVWARPVKTTTWPRSMMRKPSLVSVPKGPWAATGALPSA